MTGFLHLFYIDLGMTSAVKWTALPSLVSPIDLGFNHWLCKTKGYEIEIC